MARESVAKLLSESLSTKLTNLGEFMMGYSAKVDKEMLELTPIIHTTVKNLKESVYPSLKGSIEVH